MAYGVVVEGVYGALDDRTPRQTAYWRVYGMREWRTH